MRRIAFSRRPKLTAWDVALTWDKFPYPLQQTRGRISVRPDEVAFDLLAKGGGADIGLTGHIKDPGPAWQGWFESQSPGPVPIDETLFAAASENLQKVVRPFGASGALSFAARFSRNAEFELQKKAVLRLADVSMKHEAFPYALSTVSGQMEMVNDNWTFSNIQARNGSTSVVCNGRFDRDDRGGMLKLDIVGNNVLLDSELRDSVSSGSQQMWRQMQPRGTVDRVAATFELAKKVQHKRLVVTLEKFSRLDDQSIDSLSVTPTSFPYRIDDVSGVVQLVDGQLTMTNVRGRHGSVRLSTSGTVRSDRGGSWVIDFRQLTADQLRVDREFLDAAPENLGRALRSVAVQGPLSLVGNLQITHNPRAPNPIATSWNLDIDLEGGTVGQHAQLRHVSGGLHLVGQATGGVMQCLGDLQLDSLTHRGIQITNVHGPIRFDGNRILSGACAGPGLSNQSARRLSAQVFGGVVHFDSQLQLDEQGTFESQIDLANADFATMLRDGAKRKLPVNGKAFAHLRLVGNCQGRQTWRGGGTMQLRNSDMYELPIVLALLKTARTGSTDRTAFTDADVKFQLQGENIYLDRIDLNGDALTLKGIGEISRNRQVNINFYSVLGRESSYVAAVRPLLGMASRRFLLVKVRGTLDSPEMTREVLPGLNETLQQWFPEASDEGEMIALPSNGSQVQQATWLGTGN